MGIVSFLFIAMFLTFSNSAMGVTLDGMPLDARVITVDNNWKSVAFVETLTDPVVVAKPLSFSDSDPAVVRIRNVSAQGFEIRVQEWDYLDGEHPQEQVAYLAIDRGDYTLQDGTRVEAGLFATASDGPLAFVDAPYSQAFNVTPVVIASVTSFNDETAVASRLKDIDTNGFRFAMQEEADMDQVHGSEEISYIAWEPSSGALSNIQYEVGRTENAVTMDVFTITFANAFSQAPFVTADMQTAEGPDPAALRIHDVSTDSFQVNVEEELSDDDDRIHTTESVGYIAVFITPPPEAFPFWIELFR